VVQGPLPDHLQQAALPADAVQALGAGRPCFIYLFIYYYLFIYPLCLHYLNNCLATATKLTSGMTVCKPDAWQAACDDVPL